MTPMETATLVRYIESLCPQQHIDDYTYETWHDVIGHLEFDAARNAVIAVVHGQPFVAPSDIIREASRARKAHPSDRTVGEALAAANLRELGAAPATPPTPEYLAARKALDDRLEARMAGIPAVLDMSLSVACPWCHASPGVKCVNPGTGLERRRHEAREQAARQPAA